MKSQDGSIQRWLSSVQDQPPNDGGIYYCSRLTGRTLELPQADSDAGLEGHRDPIRNTNTKIPDIQLEVSESARRRHTPSKKRTGHYETTASPVRANRKKPRQNFELRPRNKTREDRYEYKSISVQNQSHTKKVKPRARRHTMNDDFQAINVTQNRLTVRRASELRETMLTWVRCATLSIWGFSARARPLLPTVPLTTHRSLAPNRCHTKAPASENPGLILLFLR